MDWLEEELKQALARKMPSADFAARATAAAEKRRPHAWRPWLAAAAAVLLVAGGSLEYRAWRGRVAKERVLLALRITSGKLNYIQARAQRTARRLPAEVRQ